MSHCLLRPRVSNYLHHPCLLNSMCSLWALLDRRACLGVFNSLFSIVSSVSSVFVWFLGFWTLDFEFWIVNVLLVHINCVLIVLRGRTSGELGCLHLSLLTDLGPGDVAWRERAVSFLQSCHVGTKSWRKKGEWMAHSSTDFTCSLIPVYAIFNSKCSKETSGEQRVNSSTHF